MWRLGDQVVVNVEGDLVRGVIVETEVHPVVAWQADRGLPTVWDADAVMAFGRLRSPFEDLAI